MHYFLIWLTFLFVLFTGWCGGVNRAAINSSSGENKVEQATTATLSLDFTPMTTATSIFVSITADNQAKVVRYSRSLLVVKSLGQGLLLQQDASRLLDQVRALAATNAVCAKSFGTPGLTRGDQFHLTFNVEQKQTECVGFVEDAPAAVRGLVQDVLSASQKLTAVDLAEAYVRSEPISPSRYEALRKSPSLKFFTLDEFPGSAQQTLSLAINHPRHFIALSMEQRKTLLDRISNGQELFITSKNSGHQLTLFGAQK